eukprot:2566256-Rhodomonas_salina.2
MFSAFIETACLSCGDLAPYRRPAPVESFVRERAKPELGANATEGAAKARRAAIVAVRSIAIRAIRRLTSISLLLHRGWLKRESCGMK